MDDKVSFTNDFLPSQYRHDLNNQQPLHGYYIDKSELVIGKSDDDRIRVPNPVSFVARHLFERFSSRREANAGSQMAFPKSCSLALDIRVLRDMGMVGQSRARLPLQRPQRALHADLFRYEGCFGRSQYLRHASLPSSCFVRVSYNKWWLRCGEREGGRGPLSHGVLFHFRAH